MKMCTWIKPSISKKRNWMGAEYVELSLSGAFVFFRISKMTLWTLLEMSFHALLSLKLSQSLVDWGPLWVCSHS